MGKTVLVVANWKSNGSLADAHVLAMGVRNECEHIDGVQVVLCPPAVWLTEVRNIVHDQIHHLAVGLQDISSEPAGAYTGEIAAALVAGLAQFVIIGHSERQRLYRESDEQLHEKIRAALTASITPVICVGEQQQSSTSKVTLARQLDRVLHTLTATQRNQCIIAYEPVWAISKGKLKSTRPASAEYANEVAEYLHRVVPATTKIIYGGSVDAANVLTFVAQPHLDGVLVGAASLHLREFSTLIKNAAKASDHADKYR
ncbi:MAG: triose-phosphate isomerase [bacterium]|nr:triose-phosphate isomerase [bacterium]